MLDPLILKLVSIGFGLLFLLAAVQKLTLIYKFRATLSAYELLPGALIAPVSISVPIIEALLGAAWLLAIQPAFVALASAVLLASYTSAIAINLLRGRRTIDCGCGGTEQKQAISEWLIFRNGILLFFAYAVITNVQTRELGWLDWIVVLLATATGCLFYNIVNQLLVNKDLLKALRTHHG